MEENKPVEQAPNQDAVAKGADVQPPATTEKTYTAQELAAAKKEWEKESKALAAQEAKQAAELAKLSDLEREKTLREAAETKLKEAADKLRANELKEITVTKLNEAKLPPAAAEFVQGDSEAVIAAKVTAFAKLLETCVQAGVDARFKQHGYEVSGSTIAPAKASGSLADAIAAELAKQ